MLYEVITEYAPNMFKYQVDFDRIDMKNVNAITASRPTNPTGNVLTDDEIARLCTLAEEHEIPLVLDNAYGLPFPGIIFVITSYSIHYTKLYDLEFHPYFYFSIRL